MKCCIIEEIFNLLPKFESKIFTQSAHCVKKKKNVYLIALLPTFSHFTVFYGILSNFCVIQKKKYPDGQQISLGSISEEI